MTFTKNKHAPPAAKFKLFQKTMGWNNSQCVAFFGITESSWRKWKRGMHSPRQEYMERIKVAFDAVQTDDGRALMQEWVDGSEDERKRREADAMN